MKRGSGNDHELIQIPYVEFNGYCMDDYHNNTLDQCRKQCLNICSCIAFYQLYNKNQGLYVCNLKALLLNRYKSSSVDNSMYIKLPRSVKSSSNKGNQNSELALLKIELCVCSSVDIASICNRFRPLQMAITIWIMSVMLRHCQTVC